MEQASKSHGFRKLPFKNLDVVDYMWHKLWYNLF